MIEEYTSLLYSACLRFKTTGMPSPDCCAYDQSRAVCVAPAKIRPLRPAPAFCDAALYIFSKIRGTARMNVGLNALKSARIVFKLLDRPSETLPAKQKNCM